MEKFIVSARKYRPQNFSTVVGQQHITTTLKNAIKNNQLAHAFLFCGPRGVGKTTCARILGKTINCENRQANGEACNECVSCVSFNNNSSFNIHELDAASNNSVEDIRTLTEQVRFVPQAGKYKVYIIDEVHMLSAQAFNAFLKTLEEPPSYAIFILATTEKHKILPTILSRCQIFDFKRITTQDTVDHLAEICEKEAIKAEKTALHIIAQKSEGCMRDSLSILDKIASFTNHELTYSNTLEHLNILYEDYYFKLLDYMQQQQLAETLLLFEEINSKGFEGEQLLTGMAEFFRNLMVCRDPKTIPLLEAIGNFKEKYEKAAQKLPLSWLLSALQIINDTELNYKQARNKRLHIEMALIKLTFLYQAIEVTDEASKKKLDGVKAVSFRAIPIIAYKPKNTEEKHSTKSGAPALYVEQAAQTNVKQNIAQEKQVPQPTANPSVMIPEGGMSLANIRKMVASQQKQPDVQVLLTEESLQMAWQQFIEKLAHNPSASNNFKLARLQVVDLEQFDIYTDTVIQQKFIEMERGQLIEHLHDFFKNRQIKYNVLLDEQVEDVEPKERPLSPREQYLKIIEMYPIVKEFKDKLGLGLDY